MINGRIGFAETGFADANDDAAGTASETGGRIGGVVSARFTTVRLAG